MTGQLPRTFPIQDEQLDRWQEFADRHRQGDWQPGPPVPIWAVTVIEDLLIEVRRLRHEAGQPWEATS